MTQTSLFTDMGKRAATATRFAMFTAGVSVAWAANAANCTDAPVNGHSYYIVNKDSGLQLDVAGGKKDVGTAVIQWTPGTQANQQWTFNQLGNGAWTIRAVHSGQALDLYGYDTREDAPIKQYTLSNQPNQQWWVAGSTDNNGSYTLTSVYSGKLLTVANKSTNTPLQQHSDLQGTGLQRWYFNPADGNKCGAAAATPFGSFMGFTRILIGGSIDERDPTNPNDKNTTDTLNKAPWDMRYTYIHSPPAPYASCYTKCTVGCNSTPDGGWWGCWSMTADGKYGTEPAWNIRATNDKNTNGYRFNGLPHHMMQQWTWYSGEDIGKMQAKLDTKNGLPQQDHNYAGAVNNGDLLRSYLDDYRFFLDKIGTSPDLIELEPDFWGFLRQKDPKLTAHPNDPHFVPAAVQYAGRDECKTEENSVSGLVSCMIKMARNHATKSSVGMHLSCWDITEPDSAYSGPKACIRYYQALGAGKGDFLVGDVTDRDAAWAAIYQPSNGKYYAWDDARFDQFLALVKQVTEGVGKPMVLWQIPFGNENMTNHLPTDPNDPYGAGQWKDDKVKHFFTNMDKVADAHIVALQFGAGWGQQTSTVTDGGYFLRFAQDYYRKGGVRLR